MKAKVGDKVRIKTSHARGVIQRIKGKSLFVSLDEGGAELVEGSELTNFSLAARKAWDPCLSEESVAQKDHPKQIVFR